MKILIPISLGELVDKLTILNLKLVMIKEPDKLEHVTRERDELFKVLRDLPMIRDERFLNVMETLANINKQLWHVEENLRLYEKKSQFHGEFIDLARSVYKLNDQRARQKRKLNETFGSDLMEVKSLPTY
jgi:methyl coenzyme M reductase subunit C-like uncharacterized protein (methanogenesis marker protein 7)